MEKEVSGTGSHVVLLPFPAQGHINPMLHFAKRLASKGVKATLAMTVYLTKSMHAEVNGVGIDTISDGFDDSGSSDGPRDYLERFKQVGSKTLADLIRKHENSFNPITCIVYDSICPWALDVAKELGLFGASFFTQSGSVTSIYYQVKLGGLSIPVIGPTVCLPGLPTLALSDMPTFICDYIPFKFGIDLLLSQFSNIDKADWLLFNTIDKLETEVINWMKKLWPVLTIGPAIPSKYLGNNMESEKSYSLNIFKPSSDAYMKWLSERESGSVIYMSFGSFATLCEEQIEELAWGLRQSGKDFLWVVRETEQCKLPKNFAEEVHDKGLVVSWCSQLEVLAQDAVGCFISHCGWNSTLEALSLGVPMVAVPQISDQTTNAKFVDDAWGVGIRARVDAKGIFRRDELELCIRKVMHGESGGTIKQNVRNWSELAKEAVGTFGSSDANIHEFVSGLNLV